MIAAKRAAAVGLHDPPATATVRTVAVETRVLRGGVGLCFVAATIAPAHLRGHHCEEAQVARAASGACFRRRIAVLRLESVRESIGCAAARTLRATYLRVRAVGARHAVHALEERFAVVRPLRLADGLAALHGQHFRYVRLELEAFAAALRAATFEQAIQVGRGELAHERTVASLALPNRNSSFTRARVTRGQGHHAVESALDAHGKKKAPWVVRRVRSSDDTLGTNAALARCALRPRRREVVARGDDASSSRRVYVGVVAASAQLARPNSGGTSSRYRGTAVAVPRYMMIRALFPVLVSCFVIACSEQPSTEAGSASAASSAKPKTSTSPSTATTSAAATTATAAATATTIASAAAAPTAPEWLNGRAPEEISGLHLPGKPTKKELPPGGIETGLAAKFWYTESPEELAKAMRFYFAQDGWTIDETREVVGNPVFVVSKGGARLSVSVGEQISAKKTFIFVGKA